MKAAQGGGDPAIPPVARGTPVRDAQRHPRRRSLPRRRQQLQQRQLLASRPWLGLPPSPPLPGGKTVFKSAARTFPGARTWGSGKARRPASYPASPRPDLNEDSQVLASSATLPGGRLRRGGQTVLVGGRGGGQTGDKVLRCESQDLATWVRVGQTRFWRPVDPGWTRGAFLWARGTLGCPGAA